MRLAPVWGDGPPVPVRARREGSGAWMDNGRLRVQADAGGAVRVEGVRPGAPFGSAARRW
jgi:hypothetical protein